MRAPGEAITWEDFKDAFLRHHIPEGLMERKRGEFFSLTQGKMDVLGYNRAFNNLSCYAGDEVSTDAKKQARFRKGFNPALKYALNLVKMANFEELVDTALKAEHGRVVFEESRKHSREGGSSSNNSAGPPQKRKLWVPNSALARGTYVPGSSGSAPRLPAPAPRTIAGPPRPTGPRPGVTCYKCGQEGHISPQCPQNLLPPPSQPRPAPTQAMVRAPAPQRPTNPNKIGRAHV